MHPASSWCEEGTRRARKIQSGVDVVVLLHFVLLLSFLATLRKSNSRRDEGVKQGRTLPARFAWERHPNEKYKANYRSEMLLFRVANAKLAAVHRHRIIVDKIHGTKLKLIDNFARDLWFGSNYGCKKYVRGTRREWNCFATVTILTWLFFFEGLFFANTETRWFVAVFTPAFTFKHAFSLIADEEEMRIRSLRSRILRVHSLMNSSTNGTILMNF